MSVQELELDASDILGATEERVIDTAKPILDESGVAVMFGLRGRAVIGIEAADKTFLVIDLRKHDNPEVNADFLIIDEDFSWERGWGYKGIRENEREVVMGRSRYINRFDYPVTVSPHHFGIRYEAGELIVRNLEPRNGTKLIDSWEINGIQFGIDDERTGDAIRRAKTSFHYRDSDEIAPYGYYKNHPIIGRSSLIVSGGVYLGGTSREAIVVDDNSPALTKLLRSRTFNRLAATTITTPKQALQAVLEVVQRNMRYDADATVDITEPYKYDELVGLSTFVEAKVGVCRHQALLTAFLLESLINAKQIRGRTWVERNTKLDRDDGGTHAWAMFETPKGKRFVVDAAHSFIGTKDEAEQLERWDYRLETDIKPVK